MAAIGESLQSEFVSSNEKAEYLEKFLLNGGSLIRDKKYTEAIKYFDSKKTAEKVGFSYSDRIRTTCVLLSESPTSEDIPDIANAVASVSWFKTLPDQTKRIILSTVVPYTNTVIIPESLFHEISLIHMEEWLHGLQYVRSKPRSVFLLDHELDVAIYMYKHKIPKTETFQRRYGRASMIDKLKNKRFVSHIKNFTNIAHFVKNAFNRKEK